MVTLASEQVDVVLVSPPFALAENFGLLDFVGQYGLPLSLVYLASSLERAGLKTRLVDLSYESKSLEECARDIVALNPEFIGMATHFTFLVPRALELVTLIKRLKPDVTILAGGIHLTAVAHETMEHCPGIDVGLLGEADEAAIEVIRRVRAGQDLNDVNGIIFRKGDELVKVGSPNLIKDIDSLPMPVFDKIDISGYSFAMYKQKRSINFPVVTSRGCPFTCKFCDRTVLGKSVRLHSTPYISKMIDRLVNELGAEFFDIEDENICLNKKRFAELCGILKEKHLQHGITWNCSMRVDSVDPERARMLYEAGCRSCTFGLESGSRTMLENYSKHMGIDVREVPEKCKMIRDTGIVLSGSFIIGGPGETEETIEETVDMVRKADLDYLYVWYFTPYPGTAIHANLAEEGELVGDYSHMTGQHISFIPKTLTRHQLVEGYKRIFRVFYTKPSVVVRVVKKYRLSQVPKLCRDGIKYLQRFVVPA